VPALPTPGAGSTPPSSTHPRITIVIDGGAERTKDRAVVPWSSVGYGRAPAEILSEAARPTLVDAPGATQ